MLSNLAAIVDLELMKREADTSASKWTARALITCKAIFNMIVDNLHDLNASQFHILLTRS